MNKILIFEIFYIYLNLHFGENIKVLYTNYNFILSFNLFDQSNDNSVNSISILWKSWLKIDFSE